MGIRLSRGIRGNGGDNGEDGELVQDGKSGKERKSEPVKKGGKWFRAGWAKNGVVEGQKICTVSGQGMAARTK